MARRLVLLVVLIVASLPALPAAASPALARSEFWARVDCFSPTACLAAGTFGSVAGTSDGTTWARRTRPPDADALSDVACVSAVRCYVVGSDIHFVGRLWATSDGGASWVAQPTFGGISFNGISCPSSNLCVAVGDAGSVSVTTDGGSTWNGQSLSDVNHLYDVDCATTAVCEALGNSNTGGGPMIALRTTDGGQHWAASPLPDTFGQPYAIDCTAVDRCVAVGNDRINNGRQVARVFVTGDGGASWRRRATPDGYTTAAGVSCPTAAACYLGTYGTTSVLATTDGGASWQPQGPTGVVLHGVTCTSVTTCVAVGGVIDSGRGAVFTTTNAGRTWRRSIVGS